MRRGGSWNNTNENNARCAYRNRNNENNRNNNIGFRVAVLPHSFTGSQTLPAISRVGAQLIAVVSRRVVEAIKNGAACLLSADPLQEFSGGTPGRCRGTIHCIGRI
ncbi:hypothetical protein ACFLXQ_08835 [Chloroflexota bacterium]